MDTLLDTLFWPGRNRSVDVFLEQLTYRVYTSAAYPADDTQPMQSAGTVTPTRNFAPGAVMLSFPEGNELVKVTATATSPYGVVSREATTAPTGPGDIDITVAYQSAGTGLVTVTATITTSRPPYFSWLNSETPEQSKTVWSVTEGTSHNLTVRDAGPFQRTISFQAPYLGQTEPAPAGQIVDSFDWQGNVVDLYDSPATDTEPRRIVPYSPGGYALPTGLISAGIRGRQTQEQIGTACEAPHTLVTYRALLVSPYASVTESLNSVVCNYVPPVGAVRGCTDRNATNFNEAATEEDGSCQYSPDPVPTPNTCQDPEADTYGSTSNGGVCQFSPKLTLDAVPELVPLGRPVLVTLHSAPIVWATPAPAQCRINLSALQPGAELVLNGFTFTAGPATEPQRFADAETLIDAVRSVPALAAAYTAAQTDAAEVTLTARRNGRRYNVVATADGLTVTLTSGQDTFYSERREEWGLWLEVWAVPAAPFGSTGKPAPQLAARLESRHREDNAYQFDIAEPLRQFTGLRYDGSDRLTGYFLRYGETYAEAAGGFRRNRQVGESALLFGLEAVEIMPPAVVVTPLPGTGPGPAVGFPYVLPAAFDPAPGSGSGGSTSSAPGFRRLSRRPGPVLLAGQLTTLLNPVYAGVLQVDIEHRTAMGVVSTEYDVDQIRAGGLTTVRAVALAAPADAERSRLLLSGALAFTARPAAAGSRVLSFANGQGGMESVAFAPVAEPQAKRTTQLVMTTTGRRTYAAELADVRRLTTGPLPQDVYEWLLVELGNSAAVWLETTGEPLPVNLTDFDAQADYLSGEFSLTVEIEPQQQPARGLTN